MAKPHSNTKVFCVAGDAARNAHPKAPSAADPGCGDPRGRPQPVCAAAGGGRGPGRPPARPPGEGRAAGAAPAPARPRRCRCPVPRSVGRRGGRCLRRAARREFPGSGHIGSIEPGAPRQPGHGRHRPGALLGEQPAAPLSYARLLGRIACAFSPSGCVGGNKSSRWRGQGSRGGCGGSVCVSAGPGAAGRSRRGCGVRLPRGLERGEAGVLGGESLREGPARCGGLEPGHGGLEEGTGRWRRVRGAGRGCGALEGGAVLPGGSKASVLGLMLKAVMETFRDP